MRFLSIRCTGLDRDARGINALFRYQVVLGVDGALRCVVLSVSALRGLFRRGRFAHHHDRCIRLLLQVQCHFVKAGLGVVVYAVRTLRILLEGDRAESLCVRNRRSDGHRGSRRCGAALVVRHVAIDGRRAHWSAR